MVRLELEKIIDEEYHHKRASAPTSAWVSFSVGYAAMIDDELEKACLALKKSIELDPSNTLAHQILGLVYANSGENEKAIDCFKQCIDFECRGLTLEIEEENPYFHMAWCFEDMRNLEAAENAYRKDIESCPLHYNGYFRLAKLYHTQGNFEEAKRVYEQALSACKRHSPQLLGTPLFTKITFNLERAQNSQPFEECPSGWR
jgi:tetratricopeptide (TPR) repeat protein